MGIGNDFSKKVGVVGTNTAASVTSGHSARQPHQHGQSRIPRRP